MTGPDEIQAKGREKNGHRRRRKMIMKMKA